MSSFFGKKKKDVAPSPSEAIQKLRSTEEMLLKKQEFLEGKITNELKIAKQNGTKNKRGKYCNTVEIEVFFLTGKSLKKVDLST